MALLPLKCNVFMAKELLEQKRSAVVASALREGFRDPSEKGRNYHNLMQFNLDDNYATIEESISKIK